MNDKPSKCGCGTEPEVFDLRENDWVVHCPECLEGTLPNKTVKEAIEEWESIK